MEKVIVLFSGHSSASPLRINAASRNTCEIIFLVNKGNFFDDNSFKYLGNKAIFLEFTDTKKLVELVNEINPDGITTFCEEALEVLVWLSNLYNLKGNSEQSILNIVDKYNQRTLLNKDEELYVNHKKLQTEDTDKLKEYDFPVIIKPIRGFGSKEVFKVNSRNELNKYIEDFRSNNRFYLEEFLSGNHIFENPLIGDYVSVETISNLGIHTPIAITLKLAQKEDFAETGMFICDILNKNLEEKIERVTVKALDALSFENGVTHTEIKLTNQGPKIIEVNGRLGGYVSDLVKRKYSVDLINLALQVSFKNEIDYHINSHSDIFYQKFIIPEVENDSQLVKILNTDREDLIKISESLIFEKVKSEGSIIKNEERTQRIVGIVYGQCSNFSSFLEEIRTISNKIKPLLKEKVIE